MRISAIRRMSKVFAVAVVVVLFVTTYFIAPGSFKAQTARAASTAVLSGWAWSENIGWISFNSTSDGSAFPYSVNVDTSTKGNTPPGTGLFSGYAWSETIGWISFNGGETSACGLAAQMDWATGKASGFARALAGSTTSGWDGCIKLAKDSADPILSPDYGVIFSGSNFSGFAWGSAVIGWIDFGPIVNGTLFGVRVNGSGSCPPSPVVSGSCTPPSVCPAGTPFSNGTATQFCSATGAPTGYTSCTGTCPSAPAPGRARFWQF